MMPYVLVYRAVEARGDGWTDWEELCKRSWFGCSVLVRSSSCVYDDDARPAKRNILIAARYLVPRLVYHNSLERRIHQNSLAVVMHQTLHNAAWNSLCTRGTDWAALHADT